MVKLLPSGRVWEKDCSVSTARTCAAAVAPVWTANGCNPAFALSSLTKSTTCWANDDSPSLFGWETPDPEDAGWLLCAWDDPAFGWLGAELEEGDEAAGREVGGWVTVGKETTGEETVGAELAADEEALEVTVDEDEEGGRETKAEEVWEEDDAAGRFPEWEDGSSCVSCPVPTVSCRCVSAGSTSPSCDRADEAGASAMLPAWDCCVSAGADQVLSVPDSTGSV